MKKIVIIFAILFCFGYFLPAKADTYNWTKLTATTSAYWLSVAIDDDGKNMLAGQLYDRLYMSNDYGNSWVEQQPYGNNDASWSEMSGNASGTKFIVENGTGVYIYDETSSTKWREVTQFHNYDSGNNANFKVDCDATGDKMIVSYSDYVYRSVDGGNTWTDIALNGLPDGIAWSSIGVNSTGEIIVLANGYNDDYAVYQSNNGGSSWNQVYPAGYSYDSFYWRGIAVSDDGSRIWMVDEYKGIYMYNANKPAAYRWQLVRPLDTVLNPATDIWLTVYCDSDCSTVSVGSTDYVYISTDGGSLWNLADSGIASSTNWYGGAVKRDGSNVYALNYSENSFVYYTGAIPSVMSSPTAPSNVSTTPMSTQSILLSWNDESINESNFLVEHSYDGTNFSYVTTTNSNTTSTLLSAAEYGFTANSYHWFRVRAVNTNGLSSYATSSRVYTLAEAPTNFTVSNLASNAITLSWTGDYSSEYFVSSSAGNNSGWISTSTVNRTYQFSDLACNTGYNFSVKGRNGDGVETAVAYLDASTTACAALPAAPSNLVIDMGGNNVTIDWVDNSGEGAGAATGFIVASSSDGYTYHPAQTLYAANMYGVMSATIGATRSNMPFWFGVAAFNGAGTSTYATTSLPTYTLASDVTSLVGTSTVDSVSASWQGNATLYNVTIADYSVSSSNPQYTTFSTTTQSVSLNGLQCGYKYYRIYVDSVNHNGVANSPGDLDNTPNVRVYTAACPPPIGPTNLSVLSTGTSTVGLSWVDNSSDEMLFYIEKSLNGVNFSGGVAVVTNTTSTVLSGLSPNVGYWLRVSSFNTNGFSSYATSSRIYTLASSPSSITVVATTANQVTLSWSGDATQYYASSSVDTNSGWVSTTSYSFSGLTCGTSYNFSVKGRNGDGIETDSAYITAATGQCGGAPNAPSSLSVGMFRTSTNVSAVIGWHDNASDEDGFKVFYSTDGINFIANTSTVVAGVSTDTVQSLLSNHPYWFGVAAFNAVGTSTMVTTTNPTYTLSVPAVNLTSSSTTSSITVAWQGNATLYNVEMTGASVSNGATNSNSITFSGLTCGTGPYTFYVNGANHDHLDENEEVTSAPSVTAYTADCPSAPATPTSFSATVNSPTQITLQWSGNAENYYVSYGNSNSNWISTTNYVASGLSCGTSYTFSVKGKNIYGESASASVTATTRACAVLGGGGGGGGGPTELLLGVDAIRVKGGNHVKNRSITFLLNVPGATQFVTSFYTDIASFLNWKDYTTDYDYYLTGATGEKELYFVFRNANGLSSQPRKVTIFLEQPTTTPVTANVVSTSSVPTSTAMVTSTKPVVSNIIFNNKTNSIKLGKPIKFTYTFTNTTTKAVSTKVVHQLIRVRDSKIMQQSTVYATVKAKKSMKKTVQINYFKKMTVGSYVEKVIAYNNKNKKIIAQNKFDVKVTKK